MNSTRHESTGAKKSNGLRLVLVTNGLRPVSDRFTQLQGSPIGVVSWDSQQTAGLVERLSRVKLLARLYALVRRRKYASLSHLCLENQLLYVSLEKNQPEQLRQVLNAWKTELVITSGCPLVPLNALSGVKHGGINLHPSLLPAYRGADPFAWQIIDQVQYMGVSVHRLVDRYDAGSILGQTRLLRPRAAHRLELVQSLEGDIGIELLNQVLDKLEHSADIAESVQPECSPTRRATRMSLNLLGDTWKLNDLDVDQAWDILKYYGQCPQQWLDLQGWRKLLSWKPASFQYRSNPELPVDSRQWLVKKVGLTIVLINRLAVITLRPQIRVRNH